MLKEYARFYFFALNREEREIYYTVYQGLKERKKYIEIRVDTKKYSEQDICRIVDYVYNDTPSFYYLDVLRYNCCKIRNGQGYLYSRKYIYTEKEIEKYDAQLEKIIEYFKRKYLRENMTEYEKELAIYNYLVTTIQYKKSASNEVQDCYNVIGALIKRKAVCWGIACAFKLLCDYCGLKSFVIIGEKYPRVSNEGHAWNIIKLGKEYYHLDATWDLEEKAAFPFHYEYFNLKDFLIRRNHRWEEKFYPVCKAHKYNYYYLNKLFVSKVDQIAPFVAKQLQKGVKCVTFKFSAELPEEDVIITKMEEGYSQVYPHKGVKYYYSISKGTHNIYFDITESE